MALATNPPPAIGGPPVQEGGVAHRAAAASTTRCGYDWISGHRTILLLGFVLAGAAYLRLHLLTDKSFWLDEGFSVLVPRLGWRDFLHLLWVREANMASYYVLLRLWLKLGMSEAVVRGFSVLFGLAAIPVVYALGARLFRPRVGLTAAFLLSVNAFHVRYSQEARAYTLLVFLAALCSLQLLRCLEAPTARNWSLYTAACLLVAYTHFYGILLVAAHWLSLAWLPRQQRAGLFRCIRFFVYGVAPIAIFLHQADRHAMHWVARSTAASTLRFFFMLTGNGGYLLLGAYVLAWMAAAHARWRSKQMESGPWRTWRYDLLFIWLAFPVGTVLVVSYWHPLFVERYLIFCLPAAVLLAAAGIWHFRVGAVRIALLLLLATLCLDGVRGYYRHDFDLYRSDWRAATRYVLAKAQPGDGIFFYTGPGRMTFEYYRLLAGKPIDEPLVLYPTSGDHLTYRDFLVKPLAEVLQEPLPQPKRVWLFLNEHRAAGHMDMGSEIVTAWFSSRYVLQSKHTVDGIDLLLFTKPALDSNGEPPVRGASTRISQRR